MDGTLTIPYDAAAELSVIGSMVVAPDCFGEVSEIVSADDFYDSRNRAVWQAGMKCAANGLLDLVTLDAQLRADGTLDKIGGMEYVLNAVDNTPSTEAVARYAELVADCGRRRRLIKGYNAAYKALCDMSKSVDGINAEVQRTIITPNMSGSSTTSFAEAFDDFAGDYTERRQLGRKIPGIPSGFEYLDEMVGGFEKGKLYIVGGRPGMGKTALALNMAWNMAQKEKNVAVFSLEMPVRQVVKRIVQCGAGINGVRITNTQLNKKERARAAAVKTVAGERIIINDESALTVEDIISRTIAIQTRLSANDKALDCVIVDHLHLLRASGRRGSRRDELADITAALKLLAKKTECPIIVPTQLSRDFKGRADKRPLLTDLRDSGTIEQDADVVMFVHRDSYYSGKASDDSAEIIVAKNREGMTGKINVWWNGNKVMFTEKKWSEQPIEEVLDAQLEMNVAM